LRWIIDQATTSLDVWLADGKTSGEFNDLGVQQLVSGPVDCVSLCEEAAVLISERQAGFDRPLMLVVDEAAAITLRTAGDQAKDARERKDRFLSALSGIALMGRSAGVHLLIAL